MKRSSSSGSYPPAGGRRFESSPRHYQRRLSENGKRLFFFEVRTQMMFTVYALHSPGYDQLYNGYSSHTRRSTVLHNKLGHGWTEHFRPWQIVYTEEVDSKKEAMK